MRAAGAAHLGGLAAGKAPRGPKRCDEGKVDQLATRQNKNHGGGLLNPPVAVQATPVDASAP